MKHSADENARAPTTETSANPTTDPTALIAQLLANQVAMQTQMQQMQQLLLARPVVAPAPEPNDALTGKFTQEFLDGITMPGMWCDGRKLYLRAVGTSTPGRVTKNWLFRYRLEGVGNRTMGCGAFPATSLLEARQAAAKWRLVLKSGRDPIVVRDEEGVAAARARADEVAKAKAEQFRGHTFQAECKIFLEGKKKWSPRTRKAWVHSLTGGHLGALMKLPIDEIEVDDVVAAVGPLFGESHSLGRRALSRAEAVWEHARAHNRITDKSRFCPAKWQGLLKHRLGMDSGTKEHIAENGVTHHAALHWAEIRPVMEQLRAIEGITALSLQWLALTCVRLGEGLGARYDELRIERPANWPVDAIWTPHWVIDGKRMKTGKMHIVPLSPQAISVLTEAKRWQRPKGELAHGLVFPGDGLVHEVGHATARRLFKSMVPVDAKGRRLPTLHGLRQTFTNWTNEVCAKIKEGELGYVAALDKQTPQLCLAHAKGQGSAVDASYATSPLYMIRRELMIAWGLHLEGKLVMPAYQQGVA